MKQSAAQCILRPDPLRNLKTGGAVSPGELHFDPRRRAQPNLQNIKELCNARAAPPFYGTERARPVSTS